MIFSETLEQECQDLRAAHEAGIRTPRSYGCLEDLAGREAFGM